MTLHNLNFFHQLRMLLQCYNAELILPSSATGCAVKIGDIKNTYFLKLDTINGETLLDYMRSMTDGEPTNNEQSQDVGYYQCLRDDIAVKLYTLKAKGMDSAISTANEFIRRLKESDSTQF